MEDLKHEQSSAGENRYPNVSKRYLIELQKFSSNYHSALPALPVFRFLSVSATEAEAANMMTSDKVTAEGNSGMVGVEEGVD